MQWEKQGKIDFSRWMSKNEYATDFATLPTPLLIAPDVIRIYIGFCDSNNVGTISYIDVDADNPSEILNISESPVLFPGRAGCFDDNGVVPLSVLCVDDVIYLYYVGFQLGVKIPYFMFGGLAISKDQGQTFERISETPILDRKNEELYARCGMNVMRKNNEFKMWYVGTLGGGGGFKMVIH